MHPAAANLLQIVLFSTAWLILSLGVDGQSAAARTPLSREGGKTRAHAAKPVPVLSDASLEKAILQRFRASKIGSNGFTVRVAQGVATLSGTAAVAQHKGVATRLAKLAGARAVVNEIQLSLEARERMRKQAANRKSGAANAKAPVPAPRERVPPPEGRRSDTSANRPAQSEAAVRPRDSDRTEPSTESTEHGGPGALKRFRVLARPEASSSVAVRPRRAAPGRY